MDNNLIYSKMSLKDVFEIYKKDVFIHLNCHHIGTVQEFNSANQTCTISINYKKTFTELNEDRNQLEVTTEDYPVLADVPVIVLGGAAGSVRFPIQKGDTAIVLFNDRDIDTWFADDVVTSAPNSKRKHSLSDGIAIVGLRNEANALSDYDPEAAGIYAGDTKIVAKEKVTIENASKNLLELMGELIDAIKAITTAGSAAAQAVDPDSQAALDLVKTSIEELLE